MFGLGNPELGVLMLALFVVFIMFGFPIAFTLMALGVFFGYWAMGDLVFQLLVQRSPTARHQRPVGGATCPSPTRARQA